MYDSFDTHELLFDRVTENAVASGAVADDLHRDLKAVDASRALAARLMGEDSRHTPRIDEARARTVAAIAEVERLDRMIHDILHGLPA